jgi:drug/metabolite transporter (DMT)-like permease
MDTSSLSLTLALGAAAGAGFADYLAAHAARRMPVLRVAAWIQGLGLIVVAGYLAWGEPVALTSPDLAFAALAGLAVAVGIAALYGALAIGPIGVTAPTSAVVGAALPVAATVGLGQPLAAAQFLGLAFGLVGVALFASGPVGHAAGGKATGIGLAVLAGLGIGGFTLALDATGPAAGIWPLLVARGVAAATLWLAALCHQNNRARAAVDWPRLGLAALLDAAGMVAFLLALQAGHMAIVAVITALYPGFTVALAVLIDRERLQRAQLVGLAFAVAAVMLIGWRH